MPLFEIATIANDAGQYAAMVASFRKAGFDDSAARFVLYDNSRGNDHDPYEVLRAVPRSGDEPYFILCHQDVRLDLGHGADRLSKLIDELNNRFPRWRVAGNAGGDARLQGIFHLDDPNGRWRWRHLPWEVHSLDENFLVLRRSERPAASPGLSGFHFYGTDACLTALARGGRAYVIDFLLTHLSGGTPGSPAYDAARERLIEHWRRRVLWARIQTNTTQLLIAPHRRLRDAMMSPRLFRYMRYLGNPLFLPRFARD